jgi:hypothetical protein
MKISQDPSKPSKEQATASKPIICEERQLVAILLKLFCCQEPDTNSTADTSPPSINATITTSSTILNPSTMYQKFNIYTPDKAALVMELLGEMKSPEKVMLVIFGLETTTYGPESIL